MTAILEFLQENDLEMRVVTGLGTDGAATMLGCRECVAVQLKHHNLRLVSAWCVAHRTALVAHWPAQKIDYLKTVQNTLVEVYHFFQFSAVRYNRLRDLKNINYEFTGQEISQTYSSALAVFAGECVGSYFRLGGPCTDIKTRRGGVINWLCTSQGDPC